MLVGRYIDAESIERRTACMAWLDWIGAKKNLKNSKLVRSFYSTAAEEITRIHQKSGLSIKGLTFSDSILLRIPDTSQAMAATSDLRLSLHRRGFDAYSVLVVGDEVVPPPAPDVVTFTRVITFPVMHMMGSGSAVHDIFAIEAVAKKMSSSERRRFRYYVDIKLLTASDRAAVSKLKIPVRKYNGLHGVGHFVCLRDKPKRGR